MWGGIAKLCWMGKEATVRDLGLKNEMDEWIKQRSGVSRRLSAEPYELTARLDCKRVQSLFNAKRVSSSLPPTGHEMKKKIEGVVSLLHSHFVWQRNFDVHLFLDCISVKRTLAAVAVRDHAGLLSVIDIALLRCVRRRRRRC